MMVKKYDSLEGLRGLMALWVFITHSVTIAGLPFEKKMGLGWFLANGAFAVSVFVMLSGFVIYLVLERGESNSYLGFFIRRFFRLFPVYLICLVASLFLIQYSIDALTLLPDSVPRKFERIGLFNSAQESIYSHAIAHLFLLHGLLPDFILQDSAYTIIGQAWSLSLEWQFYLLAPFLYFFIRDKNNNPLSVLLIGALLSVLASLLNMPAFLPKFLILFFIGSYSCHVFLKGRGFRVLFLLGCFLIPLPTWFAAFLLWFVVLYGIYNNSKIVDFVLSNYLSLFLGRVSYGFYCVHMIVLYSLSYFWLVVLNIPFGLYYSIYILFFGLVFSLIAALFLNVLIEVPVNNFGKSIARKVANQ